MGTEQLLIYGVVGVIILLVLIKVLQLPIKLLVNGILGVVLLYIVNLIGATYGIELGINRWTVLIAAIFGIPGVAVLVIATFFK